MNENILILGSHGFIGKSFLSYIMANSQLTSFVTADFVSSEFPFNHILLDKDYSLEGVLREVKPTRVINFAGRTFGNNLTDFFNINVLLSEKLMKYSTETGAIIFLFGSAAEFTDTTDLLTEKSLISPKNYYGFSKSFQFQLSQHYRKEGAKIIYLRPFNLFDKIFSQGGIINELCRRVLYDGVKKIHIDLKEFYRDFISIEYLSYVLEVILSSEITAEDFDFNICSRLPVSYYETASHLAKICNVEIEVKENCANLQGFTYYSVGDNSKLLKRFEIKQPESFKLELNKIHEAIQNNNIL